MEKLSGGMGWLFLCKIRNHLQVVIMNHITWQWPILSYSYSAFDNRYYQCKTVLSKWANGSASALVFRTLLQTSVPTPLRLRQQIAMEFRATQLQILVKIHECRWRTFHHKIYLNDTVLAWVAVLQKLEGPSTYDPRS